MHEIELLTEAERGHLKRWLGMTLCNLGLVEVYWIPSVRRVTARAVGRQIPPKPLPRNAELVGLYGHPFSGESFAGDVDDLIIELAGRAASYR